MVTTSSVHNLMSGLVDLLLAEPALADVQVTSGHLGADSAPESIQLVSTPADPEWGALGKLRREERFRVKGIAWASRPGANEAVIRATRARAFELLAAVEALLRRDPSVGGVVRVAALVSYELDQGASPQGPKLARNVERDAAARAKLAKRGWASVILWECEPTSEAVARTVSRQRTPTPASAAPST